MSRRAVLCVVRLKTMLLYTPQSRLNLQSSYSSVQYNGPLHLHNFIFGDNDGAAGLPAWSLGLLFIAYTVLVINCASQLH